MQRKRGLNQEEHDLIKKQPLQIHPLNEPYQERRTFQGLIVPMPVGDPSKQLIVAPISGMALGLWRRQLGARMFTIQGDMVLQVDMETYREYDI